MIVLNAYAKINPFLEISSKRRDGYHEIDSVMLSVSLFDTVTLTETEGGITVSADKAGVPTDEQNIAHKAARRFLDAIGQTRGVHVDIKKRIPAEAGMGGGSADGAAVLVGLNKMLGEPLSTEALCEIGASVGADVPFCVRGGCVRVGGIGESVTELLPVPRLELLVAKTPEGISTPAAYSALDAICGDFRAYAPRSPERLVDAIRSNGAGEIANGLYNAFERVLGDLAPTAEALRRRLAALSRGALLCGSGTAVFAIFDSASDARAARDVLMSEGLVELAEVCTTHPCGVEIV